MAHVARAEVFDPGEIAIVHVINRCCRRCFLMGDDPLTGKNYDHRKRWLEERLELLAAQTLEGSRFTSVHRRIAALQTAATDPAVQTAPGGGGPDRFLAPLEIDERQDAIGSAPSRSPHRASDKGFLPMTSAQYFNLLDWTARHVVRGKPGVTPKDAPAVLQRLGIPLEDWSKLVCDFGRLFYLVAGRPTTLSTIRSRLSHRPFHIPRAAQQLLSASA